MAEMIRKVWSKHLYDEIKSYVDQYLLTVHTEIILALVKCANK